MIYARIDVNITTHEKALIAGVEALGLWTWGMCWAQLHETDGRLPRVVVMSAMGEKARVLRRLAVRLVTSGLWIENEDGSFLIRNYVTKNQTAEEIAARKEAGRLANAERQARWRNARVTQSNAPSKALRNVTVTGLEPEPTPEPTPDIKIGKDSAPPTPAPAPVSEIKNRRKPETPCPPSGAPAGEIRDWCERWGIPDGHGEFAGFLDHHRKSDARWRDWGAAWRTWLKNAAKFSRPLFNRPGAIVQSGDNRAWKVPEGME
jgi:hypothetical protein